MNVQINLRGLILTILTSALMQGCNWGWLGMTIHSATDVGVEDRRTSGYARPVFGASSITLNGNSPSSTAEPGRGGNILGVRLLTKSPLPTDFRRNVVTATAFDIPLATPATLTEWTQFYVGVETPAASIPFDTTHKSNSGELSKRFAALPPELKASFSYKVTAGDTALYWRSLIV